MPTAAKKKKTSGGGAPAPAAAPVADEKEQKNKRREELPKRVENAYENLSERFVIKRNKRDLGREVFSRQYHFLYRTRIAALRERILNTARQQLGPHVKLEQIGGLKMDGKAHFIFGVVIKQMKYRPSVLDEFVDEENINERKGAIERADCRSLTDDDDLFEIEDEQQIMRLDGQIDKQYFVTGDVVGLYGKTADGDLFTVEQVVLPEVAPQGPWPRLQKDTYVVFVSGLRFTTFPGKNREEQTELQRTRFALEEFRRWITSEWAPDDPEELEVLKNIDRVIIAGNSFHFFDDDFERIRVSDFRELETDKDAITQFDEFLQSLLYNVPVDMMSGANDPSFSMVPQQPIPKAIFPRARQFASLFATVTNPYKFSLAALQFFGTSGQNIESLSRITDGKSAHELIERTIDFGHVFPTSPDAIDSFPFRDHDPLVFEELPHVYFAGNQDHFQQSVVEKGGGKKYCVLSIPAFAKTRSVVLFNLRTLEAEERLFAGGKEFLSR